MKHRFSRRLPAQLAPSPVSALIEAAKASGQLRWDLTVSNPTALDFEYPEELLGCLSRASALRYRASALGDFEARRAIAERYQGRGISMQPEDIVLTASTSEAYSLLFKLFCDAGDSALVPSPSYPLFGDLAALDAVSLESYRLEYDGAWHLSPEELTCSERARLVISVSPNNPTGSVLSGAELRRLAGLGLPIVSDEVFGSYGFEGAGVGSILEHELEVPTVLLGGLSKELGLPQLKLGWMVLKGEAAWKKQALERLELICDSYLSVSTPVQLALPELFELGQPIAEQISHRVRGSRAYLSQRLKGTAIDLLAASGGWSACLRLPDILSGSNEAFEREDDWVRALLEQGVLVQPGYWYDMPLEPCLVLSLLTPTLALQAGVERLVALTERLSE